MVAISARNPPRRSRGSLVLRVTEVPIDHDSFPLTVAIDALTIATELRIVRRKEQQSGVHAIAEPVHDVTFAIDSTDLPVRSSGSEVDDGRLTDWRLVRFDFCGIGHDSSYNCGEKTRVYPAPCATLAARFYVSS
jgi:hypothetical protein